MLKLISGLCLSTMILCTPAAAGVIVTTPNGSVNAGGTGFVDVLISTTGGDNLLEAYYEFDLTTISGGSALTITSIDGGMIGNVFGNYVFVGTDHFGQELDVGTTLPGTTFIASDAIDLDPGVTVTNALLTRVHFQHAAGPGGLAGSVGDQFGLTLQNDGDTEFYDELGDLLTVDAGSFSTGMLTVAAASVPEPSSGLLLFAVLAITAVLHRGRNRGRKLAME